MKDIHKEVKKTNTLISVGKEVSDQLAAKAITHTAICDDCREHFLKLNQNNETDNKQSGKSPGSI